MSNETIVLKINDIVQNPFLACDYLFTVEKREQLMKANSREVKAFLDFIAKDKDQITKILPSEAYKAYINAQEGIKDYSEQVKLLEALSTTAIDAMAGGIPVSTALLLLYKRVAKFIKDKDAKAFVDDVQQALSKKNIENRLNHLNNLKKEE